MRLPHALLASLLLGALSSHLLPSAGRAADPAPLPAPVSPPPWSPPAWLPGELAWALPQLDGAPTHTGRGPSVRALGAMIADIDRGEVLWARQPDTRRPIASVTKLFSGLALASQAAPGALDATLCVTYEQWPVRPGAMSRFQTGHCHDGWQLAGAAMVHSDNRGAMALAGLAGLPIDAFADAMNAVSVDLDLDASFTEPTGLDEGDRATPRAVVKAVVATAAEPTLAALTSAPVWFIDRDDRSLALTTTNRLIQRFETLAAKTGYTDAAGYCYATVVRTASGRTLALAVLGSPTESSRFSDALQLIAWAEAQES